MTRPAVMIVLIGAVAALGSPAGAQTRDHAPVNLQSTSRLSQDEAGKESWSYINPAADFAKYRSVTVNPTVVYNGADAQFEGVDPADRSLYAQIITDALQSEMAKSFPPAASSGAGTLRLRVNLLGVTKTKGGLATATRVTPMGFGLSAAKSLLGKGGTFTGSVLYAVEAFDGQTGELLLSAVRRRTPDPLDIPATLSTKNTIEAVARDFAEAARARLERMAELPRR